MKRILAITLLAALILTGCAKPAQEEHPEWDEGWTRIGGRLAVEPLRDFELLENNDMLAPSGIYYAAWSCGQGRDFTNTEGDAATAYDAQIYLLIQDCDSDKDAVKAIESWMARESENYETGEPSDASFGDQSYRTLTLLSGREGNPYTHGAAAFAARGASAVSVEVLCADGFEGEAQEVLNRFLQGIHYGD